MTTATTHRPITTPTPPVQERQDNRFARLLFATHGGVGALLARLTLAGVFFPHGAQKVLGWFGGHGFSGTLQTFTSQMGIPTPLAVIAILTEFLAPLALVVGLFSRLAALGIGTIMLVAMFMVHLPHGFFMNWFGGQGGEGFEYHLLAIGLSLVVIVQGGGLWSIDEILARRPARAPVTPPEAAPPPPAPRYGA